MRVLLGITGSIAAYKTPELIRALVKRGIDVVPVMSRNAAQFVSKLSLETVAEHPVFLDDDMASATIPHLTLTRDVDAFIIAPATANCIAKCANGLADDLISTAFLSYQGPKAIVPAMHTEMWQSPITLDNVSRLASYGVACLGPDSGDLACGDSGEGRFVDLDLIAHFVEYLGLPKIDLSGKRIVITAGGTREAIDDVRYISNASTGKLGQLLAHMASFAGAEVTLITSVPLLVQNPHLAHVVNVASVSELDHALQSAMPNADTLYMAAAVSDYTVQATPGKMKRGTSLALNLEPTDDILKRICASKGTTCCVGFCLEDQDLDARAKDKLAKKGADFIVANHASVIGQDQREAWIYSADGEVFHIETTSLSRFVHQLLTKTG